MLETVIHRPSAISRIHHCYLNDFFDDYTDKLLGEGYAIETVRQYIGAVEHFSRWLEHRRIAREAICSRHIQSFIKNHLPSCRCPVPAVKHIPTVHAALAQLINIMGNVAPLPVPQGSSLVIETAIDLYDDFLRSVSGLSVSTRFYRRRYAREFLTAVFHKGPLHFELLTPRLVTRYAVKRACGLRSSSIQVMTCSLRSYLKFLQYNAQVDESVVAAVPRTPNWSLASLPETLNEQQIKQLLGAFDRNTPSGLRDYAMARCLVDLGLRTCEVAALQIADIDWRHSTITVQEGKDHRVSILPLPKATAQALAEYLCKGRPSTSARAVFVLHRALKGREIGVSSVRAAIRQAYRRAGLNISKIHILRHTAATRMLNAGASLKEIADVLRHRSLESTTLYTKVGLPDLACVALPWPRREL